MPFPRQRGHGWESANSPCASATTPRPPHCGTGLGRRPGLRSRSLARRARRLEADGNRRLDAAQRVLEREVELDLHVLAAPAALRLRPHAATPAAEDPAQQVAEIAEVAEVERERAARPELGTAARGAPGVVLLPLLRVGEDVVGGLDLLEHLLRLFVARVLVRVVLPRELAVGLLDLLLRSALLEAEHLVEVLSRSVVATGAHHDSGGTKNAISQAVALLDHLEDRALLGIGRLRQQRLVLVRDRTSPPSRRPPGPPSAARATARGGRA